MGNKTEVRIGRSNVKYGGVDLGFTEGEIVLTYSPEFRDFRPDQSTLICKKFLLNEGVKLTVPMAQSVAKAIARAKGIGAGELKADPVGGGGTGLLTVDAAAGDVELTLDVGEGSNFTADDFALVGSGLTAEMVEIDSVVSDVLTLKATTPLQFAHAIGEAVVEVDSTKTRIAVGNPSGIIPTAELLITPIDLSDPVKIYSALVSDELEMTLQKSEETIIEIPFEGIADESRSQGDQLFSIGDQSVA